MRFLIISQSKGFLASSLSTYDFSTLYTALPQIIISEEPTELNERTFDKECSLYLVCNEKRTFFTSEQLKNYNLCSCQKVCDALHSLQDNIFIRFGSKLFRQIICIPMGTNCVPLFVDFLCERLYVVSF